MASTVGVYGGVTAEPPYREDLPLPMMAGHVIPAFKKVGELLVGATGTEILLIELPEGRSPAGSGQPPCLDITRLRQDTGYQPAYDTGRAVADYLAWLREGPTASANPGCLPAREARQVPVAP
jgi:hypothetical protein